MMRRTPGIRAVCRPSAAWRRPIDVHEAALSALASTMITANKQLVGGAGAASCWPWRRGRTSAISSRPAGRRASPSAPLTSAWAGHRTRRGDGILNGTPTISSAMVRSGASLTFRRFERGPARAMPIADPTRRGGIDSDGRSVILATWPSDAVDPEKVPMEGISGHLPGGT